MSQGYRRPPSGNGTQRPPGSIPADVEYRGRPGRPPGTGYSGGGSVSVRTQGGGGAGFVASPPYVTKPPSGIDFQADGSQGGISNASGVVQLFAVTLPANRTGVIRSLSLLANNLLTSSDIRWTLRFNDSPVQGWSQLTIMPRAAGSVELTFTPDETYIFVPENAEVAIVVQVNDAGTYQLGASIHGWHYSTELAYLSDATYP